MDALDVTYLVAIATVSITFVGFSSVVVVFRQTQGNRLDRPHIFLVRFFIEMGLIVTVFALLPLLLAVLGLAEISLWRWASAIYALVHLAYIRILYRRFPQYAGGRFSVRRNLLPVILSIFIDALLILNAIGWPLGSTGGPYALALAWGFTVAGIFFAQTITSFVEQPPAVG